MALNLQDKKAIVEDVSEIARNAISLVLADYSGLTGADMTALRKKARDEYEGVDLRIIRNTLAKRAFEGTNCESLSAHLSGPHIFAFSKSEPGAAAKLFKDFAKLNPKLEVKALSVAGVAYEAKQLDLVAALPSRKEALQQLACMLIAPVTNLARLLKEPAGSLARAVKAKGEKDSA